MQKIQILFVEPPMVVICCFMSQSVISEDPFFVSAWFAQLQTKEISACGYLWVYDSYVLNFMKSRQDR